MTAEIGSMRIADEIDAVETMALRPIPFVVGTRLIGGMLCVVPGIPADTGHDFLRVGPVVIRVQQ